VKEKLKEAGARAMHNWTWMDTTAGAFVFGVLGYIIGRSAYFDMTFSEFIYFQKTYLLMLLQAFLAMFFWVRCWEAAKAPRPYRAIDWTAMSFMQMVGMTLKDNFVAIFAGACGLAFTLSLTPSVTDLLTKVGSK
jgi:hypothetical protein